MLTGMQDVSGSRTQWVRASVCGLLGAMHNRLLGAWVVWGFGTGCVGWDVQRAVSATIAGGGRARYWNFRRDNFSHANFKSMADLLCRSGTANLGLTVQNYGNNVYFTIIIFSNQPTQVTKDVLSHYTVWPSKDKLYIQFFDVLSGQTTIYSRSIIDFLMTQTSRKVLLNQLHNELLRDRKDNHSWQSTMLVHGHHRPAWHRRRISQRITAERHCLEDSWFKVYSVQD